VIGAGIKEKCFPYCPLWLFVLMKKLVRSARVIHVPCYRQDLIRPLHLHLLMLRIELNESYTEKEI
jgi:hypothetical protein